MKVTLAHGLVGLLLLPLAWGHGLQDGGMDRKDVERLVGEYFELGTRAVGVDRDRQVTILSHLDKVEPLDEKTEKKWREELIELWEDGPELDKKGRNYLWEDEKRGLYIVGGKNKKPKGLAIVMHGGGVGVGDAGNMVGPADTPIRKAGWVAIYPEVLEKTEHGWTDSGTEEFVLDLIDRGRRTFGVDPNKIYLTGHSMGGYGSWTLGARHADMMAALAPSAGAPTPIMDRDGKFTSIDWGVIPGLRNTRIVCYQSIDDPQVPADVNQLAAKEIERAKERWGGYELFEYWEVDGQGHGMPPGGFGELIDRIEKYERDPYPAKIVWQPVHTWKRQYYWLHWESPTPGTIIVAEVDRKAGEIRIECDRPLHMLSVYLNDELVNLKKEIKVLVNGEVKYQGEAPPRRLSTLLETGLTGDPERTYSIKLEL